MARALKIGIFFIICSCCAGIYIYKSADFFEGGTKTYYALADDAMGLLRDSNILVAGVVVGKLDKIGLENGKAKFTLKISKDLVLYENAKIEKVMESMLGTYVLVLEPGDSSAPALNENDYIKNVKTASGLSGAMEKASEIMEKTDALMEKILERENKEKIDKIIDMLVRTTENTTQSIEGNMKMLSSVLKDMSDVMQKVNSKSDTEMEKLSKILENTLKVTDRIAEISDGKDEKLNQTLDDLRNSLKLIAEELAASRGAMQDVREITSNMNQITEKVANGEGTVGKLMTDDKLYQDIVKVSDKLSDYADTLLGMKVYVDAHSNYMVFNNSFKTYFDITLQPRKDRFYLLGVVDDPRGNVSHTVTTHTTDVDGTTYIVEDDKTVVTDKLKFNLQIGRIFGPVALRGGIFQNKAGFGIDYNPWKYVSLSAEIFDFGSGGAPQLRVQGLARPLLWTMEPFSWLYITAGGEDLINGERDLYFGLGLRFDDDDLKSIVSTVPKP
ncbi:MCE family protein [bacterium]|nr:MCE family protein [bacterium]